MWRLFGVLVALPIVAWSAGARADEFYTVDVMSIAEDGGRLTCLFLETESQRVIYLWEKRQSPIELRRAWQITSLAAPRPVCEMPGFHQVLTATADGTSYRWLPILHGEEGWQP